MHLQVLHGYKASVFMTQAGVTIAVDTLFRFMSTITCLDKIRELRRQANSEQRFRELIEANIIGSSVIADWGNKRTYRIVDVDFTTNPVSSQFIYNGVETSVAVYMRDVYDRVVSDP